MTFTEADAARIALALADLLEHPDRARIAEEIRATAPVGLLDQADAASSQVSGWVEQTIKHGVANIRDAETPSWALLGLTSAAATWITGTGSTCTHKPDPERPQPVFAAIWRPGLIVCVNCPGLLDIPARVASRVCDGCSRQADQPLQEANIALRYLTLLVGACGDCQWWPTTKPNAN